MNKRYVMKTIAELQYDLENDYTETKLFDDISRAEKLFGKDVPAIHDCVEEVQHFNGTIRRNAQIVVDLLEVALSEQASLSYDLVDFQIDDHEFNKLVEQAFQYYKEARIDTATEKIWDAFERIKTFYKQYDKKGSITKLIDIVSKNNAEYREMVEDEFTSLTKLGNDFRIRHHETNKKDICCKEHYDYLFHRCIAVLRLVTSVLRENSLNENG
ncbi:hypothetical protein [Faecalibacterium duncaniae]|uniref:hypothetical protein n=1 Tax=Faecalibacterium duncaniae (strain DSM 17677 / JCM 31915 / A2-165) TaxID=411483 RepID=UPI0029404770|nr:hypothetical protein [Faecalibacterium duncaniae]MDV5041362.1 hypothetical protein [Faecalibacterium duncaniae]